MTIWTGDNTEGFNVEELHTLSEAQRLIETAHPGVDPGNIADRLNNVWTTGATVKTLVEDAAF